MDRKWEEVYEENSRKVRKESKEFVEEGGESEDKDNM